VKEVSVLDTSRPVRSELVYMVWRDHSKQDGISYDAESPSSVTLCGYTNLIDETETEYIVCQFVGDVVFCVFDRTAICKADVIVLKKEWGAIYHG